MLLLLEGVTEAKSSSQMVLLLSLVFLLEDCCKRLTVLLEVQIMAKHFLRVRSNSNFWVWLKFPSPITARVFVMLV